MYKKYRSNISIHFYIYAELFTVLDNKEKPQLYDMLATTVSAIIKEKPFYAFIQIVEMCKSCRCVDYFGTKYTGCFEK